MRRIAVVAAIAFTLSLLASGWWLRDARPQGDAAASKLGEPAIAVALDGLGVHRMDVGIDDDEVRAWFDQGLALAYAFNHEAAARAFLRGTELDPNCAMCWWGSALVLGPHLNAGMDEGDVAVAWERLQRAVRLAPMVSAREQAYIGALSTRYAPEVPTDRRGLDQAYANAMGKLAARYPDDVDARTLHAEALMNLYPWDFHDDRGMPKAWTAEIVAVLERVLSDAPQHPGANHYYIHAVEASRTPERAMAAARRLETLAPGAGHLVHMSSHIYMRTGRYHEASEANRRAIAADTRFLELCRPGQSLYARGYVPHNHHFLYASSMMEGRAAQAIAAAEEVARRMDLDRSRQAGYVALQHYWVTPMLARLRFGRWQELLNAPSPPADLAYPTAIWHYARGMALLRTGQLDAASFEHQALHTIAEHPDMEVATVWDLYRFADLLRIAREHLSGEIAAARGEHEQAIAALQRAVAAEDALRYDEPAPWFFPVRQALGAVLLDAGRAGEAQQVYEQDLQRHPNNGWSLFGLVEALAAQRRPTEEARARLQAAWKHADVVLHASRF